MDNKRNGSQPSYGLIGACRCLRPGVSSPTVREGGIRKQVLPYVQATDTSHAIASRNNVTLVKLFAAMVVVLSLFVSVFAQANRAGASTTTSAQDAQAIKITRSGSQPSQQAPAE